MRLVKADAATPRDDATALAGSNVVLSTALSSQLGRLERLAPRDPVPILRVLHALALPDARLPSENRGVGAALGGRSVNDAEEGREGGRQHGGKRPAGVVGGGGDGGDGAAEVGLQRGDALAFDGFGVEQGLRHGEGGGEAAHLEVEAEEEVEEVEVEVEVVVTVVVVGSH